MGSISSTRIFSPTRPNSAPVVLLVQSVVPSGFTASVTPTNTLNLLGSSLSRHDGSPRSRAPEQLCPVPMILLPSPSELRLNTWVAAGPVPLSNFVSLLVALVTPRTDTLILIGTLAVNPSPKERECVDFGIIGNSKASARIGSGDPRIIHPCCKNSPKSVRSLQWSVPNH